MEWGWAPPPRTESVHRNVTFFPWWLPLGMLVYLSNLCTLHYFHTTFYLIASFSACLKRRTSLYAKARRASVRWESYFLKNIVWTSGPRLQAWNRVDWKLTQGENVEGFRPEIRFAGNLITGTILTTQEASTTRDTRRLKIWPLGGETWIGCKLSTSCCS